jgi:hypothetical protein
MYHDLPRAAGNLSNFRRPQPEFHPRRRVARGSSFVTPCVGTIVPKFRDRYDHRVHVTPFGHLSDDYFARFVSDRRQFPATCPAVELLTTR